MKRILLAAGLTILISLTGFLTVRYCVQSAEENLEPQYRTVIVLKGDTLWTLAKRFGEPGKDIRRLVYTIRKINDLKSAVVYPGQKLKIPVAGE